MFGCGRHYSGVYQGKEQINTGVGGTPTTSAMTLTLNQQGSDSVTGTWQSAQGGAGTLNASATGDGLTNVQLVMASGGLGTYYSYWNTAGCQQTFTGTLSAQNTNQLTGTLVGTGGCNYSGYSTSRTIDVSK
jgi:hypothetical protein